MYFQNFIRKIYDIEDPEMSFIEKKFDNVFILIHDFCKVCLQSLNPIL